MLKSKSIKSIVADNQQDEAILLLRKQKIRNKYQHLEELSIGDIVKRGRQDEIIAKIKRSRRNKIMKERRDKRKLEESFRPLINAIESLKK